MSAQPAPRLAAGEVHLWRVGLGAGADVAVLSEDERVRAARFRFDCDRARYVAARVALRTILGAYLGKPPAQLGFIYGPAGKPGLDGDGAWLRFNVAHSADLALIAVRRGGAVGVDVERVRPIPDALSIAERYFGTAAREALGRLPVVERDREFFRSWTRFEAALKASGAGLAGAPPEAASIMHDLDLAGGYVGAVAVEDEAGPRTLGIARMVMRENAVRLYDLK